MTKLCLIVEWDHLLPGAWNLVALIRGNFGWASVVPDGAIVSRHPFQIESISKGVSHATVSEMSKAIMKGLQFGLSSFGKAFGELMFGIRIERNAAVHVFQWKWINQVLGLELAILNCVFGVSSEQ